MRTDRTRTGTILLVGPDGCGKSTVARLLRQRFERDGHLVRQVHYRPRWLMGPRCGETAPAQPHAEGPRGDIATALKLVIVMADWLISGTLLRMQVKTHRAIVITERGFFDLVVDPVRYRLSARSARLVRLLGRLQPRHDLGVLLTGNPEAIATRKPELSPREIKRQTTVWLDVIRLAANEDLVVDTTSRSAGETVEVVLERLGRCRQS